MHLTALRCVHNESFISRNYKLSRYIFLTYCYISVGTGFRRLVFKRKECLINNTRTELRRNSLGIYCGGITTNFSHIVSTSQLSANFSITTHDLNTEYAVSRFASLYNALSPKNLFWICSMCKGIFYAVILSIWKKTQ